MKKENPTNPQSLAEAEALLAKAVTAYNKTTNGQIDDLNDVCMCVGNVKKIFMALAKSQRPYPTWEEYAPVIGQKVRLRFTTSRMADYYVELGEGMAAVGIDVVKEKAGSGTFRDVRKFVESVTKKKEDKNGTQVNPTVHLKRSLKALLAAEKLLPKDLLPEASLAKASIQSIMKSLGVEAEPPAKSAIALAKKVKIEPHPLPAEWNQRFADALTAGDKNALKQAKDDLAALLKQGAVSGFPPEVTFTTPATTLQDSAYRFRAIENYMAGGIASLRAERSATNASAPKIVEVNSTSKVFKPKSVQEIADHLGGKTALGKMVGKEQGHAHYWTKTDRIPGEYHQKLIRGFSKKDVTLDLSLITKSAA